MKLSRLGVIAAFAMLALTAQQAYALSEDDKTMGSPESSARFSDPDDKTPGQAVYMQNGQAANGNVDPNSIRYDYDPSSGSYIPHKN